MSELHRQRLRLQAQIRENRRARHRAMRDRMLHTLGKLQKRRKPVPPPDAEKEEPHDEEK